MISFELITEETLYIALELLNSNEEYNRLENGQATRTEEEVRAEYMNKKTISLFIKADDTYIGLIDFMDKNEKDGYPWIGSFIIHRDYHGYGYGTQAYFQFEQWMIEHDVSAVRLGVLQQNPKARAFWERAGFQYYTTKPLGKNQVDCFEKTLQTE
ncbi:GNAT family N-acetyltransferase [Priestia abyssalis]|uniref:GNAT family N-acetyltransferase n=1 Tax=Priestia abyssalis TaxID=1221450 RepID=UPI00099568FD|nr:GNAT family N-acetyltransferase [Priestia abyssalis]